MNNWLDNYPELHGVRLNMIVAANGDFVDESGSSRGISNELDRKLIGHLRRHSDVIVTGGNTARKEQYRVPSHCSLAVISNTFELAQTNYIRIPEPSLAIENLKAQGFERILLETGPTLSKYFLKRDEVDEFCLTVAGAEPKIAAHTMASFESNLTLHSATELDGTLFTVWRRGNR